MTYMEQAVQLIVESSVAVMALSNPECTDLELMPFKPCSMSELEQAQLKARWPGRNLKSIGVIGLVGTSPRCALKAPLETDQLSALADAFLAHLHACFCDSFAAQTEAAEIAELERMYQLPDTRPN